MERLTPKSVLDQIAAKNNKQFADARKAWNCERREINLDCLRSEVTNYYKNNEWQGD